MNQKEEMDERSAEVEKRVRKEAAKLRKVILEKCDPAREKLARDLIDRAAFMKVLLEDLERKISKEGCVSTYKNGQNQYGTKKSPEVETYNSTAKNYALLLKQIKDTLPEVEKQSVDDGFDDFVQKR